MEQIHFANDGIFDIRAMLTFGVSAKDSPGAIGYFGTGFKYAVAIILRHSGAIQIKSGDDLYVFTAKKELIRGQEFDCVQVNGEDAGFTTRLGINWAPWQAYRELRCNCTDEQGEIVVGAAPERSVVVTVSCEEVLQAHRDERKYFLKGTPFSDNSYCQAIDARSNSAFYRGIAVASLEQPALLTYNMLAHTDLTEDRTIRYESQIKDRAAALIQGMTDRIQLRRVLSSKGTFESKLGFVDWHTTSDEFLDVTHELIQQGRLTSESARSVLRKLRRTGDWVPLELSELQQKTLGKAVAFLAGIGIDVGRFPVNCVVAIGDGVMGQAVDGKIYITELAFNMGTKQVASTLLEEWVHCKEGCADFDRRMQNWLFDKILSMGEIIKGEPL